MNKQIIKDLLKSFIIGSSLPAFIVLFIAVSYYFLIEKSATFSYHEYSIKAPLYLGTMALIAKLISIKFKIYTFIKYSFIKYCTYTNHQNNK